MNKTFSVVMFTGGRGTGTITEALLKHEQISLTLLVNTYDDGLSTGALRAFIPGMLGPSDVRKNLSRLIDPADRADRAVKTLLEYRFPLKMPFDQARGILVAFVNQKAQDLSADLRVPYMDLSMNQAAKLAAYTSAFVEYLDKASAGSSFDFGDCSLGNLFFAGCYLSQGKSFNSAIAELSKLSPLKGRVLDITSGENLVLVALKEDQTLLANEAQIVSLEGSVPVKEIFLLPKYLSQEEFAVLGQNKEHDALEQMRRLSKTPAVNPEAREALQNCDLIIYGPGTQHSSLFPSYLTQEVAALIAGNKSAEKIFVGNIHKDYEIRHETANTLIQKFLFYLNGKGTHAYSWNDLVTLFFFQQSPPSPDAGSDYVFFDASAFPYPQENVVVYDWEAKTGAHSGGMVVDELVSIVNAKLQRRLKSFPHTVSIIVPGLNEERTVQHVLQELTRFSIESLDLGKEVLFIDGGSTDRTLELARSVPDARVLSLTRGFGRGAAMRLGVEKASGNIIVFYPSDGEYNVKDLFHIIQEIAKNEFQVVFGSRAIKCVNLNQRILDIYQNNYFLYFSSKYGGMLVSLLSLLLYNRFITDAFTGIKAFESRLLKSLQLKSDGLNLDTEIIAKLGRRGVYILEMPVDFYPRTRQEGKKTTLMDGLKSIGTLLYFRIFK